ncbi:hypothetical protein GGI01_001337 [Coemansia sp. RSA 376]|nr:hypothetical protein GGI01_001337 [Coemansia sp. RSA 376]
MTGEVQRQPESIGAIDWSQVSQAARIFIRECLGLSYYDIGKSSWHYNLDSLSQSMASRMTRFIEEHCPVHVPANYRAVSNFMWVAMDDCICICNMLQGRFEPTEADYERAAVLRTQGQTWKDVS